MSSLHPQLTYYELDADVTAFSSTRHGGCSKGNYASFNVNEFCGDDVVAISENRKALCELLHVNHLVIPHQVHGTCCKIIDDNYFKLSLEEKKQYVEGADALITAVKNICIGISTADCVPVLMHDRIRQIGAAIHAGWRGTQKRILSSVVETLVNDFDVNPQTLKAVIGPSISLSAFEVGEEVYDCFAASGFPMNKIAAKYGDKWHIDLWEANRIQLIKGLLKEENIQTANICTFSNSQDYFSARKLTINSGRIISGIIIRK